jgi:hypothetical protein
MDGTLDTSERLSTTIDLAYDWEYGSRLRALRDLYDKSKRSQWNPDAALPWHLDVDPARERWPEEVFPLYGSGLYATLSAKEIASLQGEINAWMLSQFLHGEQGALLAASQLVTAAPDFDAKYCASTQVVDEARHVEVYDRYIRDKVGIRYDISPHLRRLLDLILGDARWDMKLLGMQIVVEGLALASFGMLRQYTFDPLLKDLIHYVMIDEARHVAFGVVSLADHYKNMSEADVREREDFVYEAAVLMRDRFLFDQVWEKAGMNVEQCTGIARDSEAQRLFRQMLFAKVVPAVKRIGLLSERQRERFANLGILEFETWSDPFQDLEAASLPGAT